jgi:hypothetical protein
MLKIVCIPSERLFSPDHLIKFPPGINVLAHVRELEADVDVVIGAHGQAEEVNLTIENYLALEKHTRLRIWVIESSGKLSNFFKIHNLPEVNRIFILDHLRCTDRKFEGKFFASNGAAVAAAIGNYFGNARYTFFSHTDMMGYKLNPLTFLLSKLDSDTPIASFMQRNILPFTGGMIFAKEYFHNLPVDWLPRSNNPYSMPWLKQLQNQIEPLSWIDTGEELVFETLARGQKVFVCASYGATGDFFGHPLDRYGIKNEDLAKFNLGIKYAFEEISREAFETKYPQFARSDNAMWRKCFNDQGEVIFIHRGRGTSKGKKNDGRGEFFNFLREFNRSFAEENTKTTIAERGS